MLPLLLHAAAGFAPRSSVCDEAATRATFGAAAQKLEAAGFATVKTGRAGPFRETFSTNMSVGGANPSSVYLQAEIGSFDEGDVSPRLYMEDGVWSLSSREAIVTVICTPPDAMYFSWEVAVLFRLTRPPADPGAPISDLFNLATLRRAHAADWSPFNRMLAIITTADARTAAAVRSVVADVAPAGAEVVVNAINATADTLHFARASGTRPFEQEVDLFQSLLRIHVADAADPAHLEYVKQHFPVMRVAPTDEHPDEPLAPVAELPRATGPGNEAGLEARVDALRASVLRLAAQRNLELADETGFTAVELNKTRCLVDPKYAPWRVDPAGGCLGTVSDGRYSVCDKNLPLSSTRPLAVVVGVDHAQMGNAGAAEVLAGTKVAVAAPRLRGSASHFGLPDDRLFAYAFATDCSAAAANWSRPFCVPLGADETPNLLGAYRYEAYMDPRTATRPSLELVQPLALLFKPAASGLA